MVVRSLLVFLFSVVAAGAAGAQCTPVAGTGCPGSVAPTCSAQPRLGTRIAIGGLGCPLTSVHHTIVGLPLQPPLALDPAVLCEPQRCLLGATPLLVLPWFGSLSIPNDPSLLFRTLTLHDICVGYFVPCVRMMQALNITFVP
jgi:hypothetical protein